MSGLPPPGSRHCAASVRLSKVQPSLLLHSHDSVVPVGSVVHVVGIADVNRLAPLARRGIDARKTVSLIVQNPQRLHVIGWRDMLRQSADGKMIDHPVR